MQEFRLNPLEHATLTAIFELMFPADQNGPGAGEIGAFDYVNQVPAGACCDYEHEYRPMN